MLPKLKRTVAVTCLLATACFVILWMRSVKHVDSLILSGAVIRTLEVQSSNGMISFIRPDPDGPQVAEPGYHYFTGVSPANGATPIFQMPAILAVNWGNIVQLPHWLLVVVNGVIGISLLLRRPIRFSLRSLAIAATLIVLTLGLGVAASRLTLG